MRTLTLDTLGRQRTGIKEICSRTRKTDGLPPPCRAYPVVDVEARLVAVIPGGFVECGEVHQTWSSFATPRVEHGEHQRRPLTAGNGGTAWPQCWDRILWSTGFSFSRLQALSVRRTSGASMFLPLPLHSYILQRNTTLRPRSFCFLAPHRPFL